MLGEKRRAQAVGIGKAEDREWEEQQEMTFDRCQKDGGMGYNCRRIVKIKRLDNTKLSIRNVIDN